MQFASLSRAPAAGIGRRLVVLGRSRCRPQSVEEFYKGPQCLDGDRPSVRAAATTSMRGCSRRYMGPLHSPAVRNIRVAEHAGGRAALRARAICRERRAQGDGRRDRHPCRAALPVEAADRRGQVRLAAAFNLDRQTLPTTTACARTWHDNRREDLAGRPWTKPFVPGRRGAGPPIPRQFSP